VPQVPVAPNAGLGHSKRRRLNGKLKKKYFLDDANNNFVPSNKPPPVAVENTPSMFHFLNTITNPQQKKAEKSSREKVSEVAKLSVNDIHKTLSKNQEGVQVLEAKYQKLKESLKRNQKDPVMEKMIKSKMEGVAKEIANARAHENLLLSRLKGEKEHKKLLKFS